MDSNLSPRSTAECTPPTPAPAVSAGTYAQVEGLLPEDGGVAATVLVVFRTGGRAAADAFATKLRTFPRAIFPATEFKDAHLEHITATPFLVRVAWI